MVELLPLSPCGRGRGPRRRRGRERGSQRRFDRPLDTVGGCKDIAVGEAKHTPAPSFKPGRPAHIRLAAMVRAVRLDNQPCRGASEVGDIGSDWILTAKLAVRHAAGPQHCPKAALGVGRLSAHSLCPQTLPGTLRNRIEAFVTVVDHNPSPSHAQARAGPSLSRKGRGGAHASIPSGFSTSALNALMNWAPTAPSMARWSKLPVALITVAMASAPSTT